MTPDITFDHGQHAPVGWLQLFAESLLEQLGRPQLFMDIDVIPGVWALRSTAIHQYQAGAPKPSSS